MTHVQTEAMLLTFEWASSKELVRFHQEVLTPLNTLLSEYPIKQRAEVWQAIEEALGQFMTPDGPCRMEGEVILAVGQGEKMDIFSFGKALSLREEKER